MPCAVVVDNAGTPLPPLGPKPFVLFRLTTPGRARCSHPRLALKQPDSCDASSVMGGARVRILAANTVRVEEKWSARIRGGQRCVICMAAGERGLLCGWRKRCRMVGAGPFQGRKNSQTRGCGTEKRTGERGAPARMDGRCVKPHFALAIHRGTLSDGTRRCIMHAPIVAQRVRVRKARVLRKGRERRRGRKGYERPRIAL